MTSAIHVPKTDSIPDFDPKKFFSSFVETGKSVLLNPKYFFRGMNRKGGIQNPFIFMVSCVLFQTLLASMLHGNFTMMARSLLLGTLFPLITAGILFLIITQLFKGQGTYEVAFRVNAYSAAVALLSWIPVVGMVLEFYRLYLIGVGITGGFSIKGYQAFLAMLLTLVVYIIASGAFAHLTAGTGVPVS
jgi:hypothetical protein